MKLSVARWLIDRRWVPVAWKKHLFERVVFPALGVRAAGHVHRIAVERALTDAPLGVVAHVGDDGSIVVEVGDRP